MISSKIKTATGTIEFKETHLDNHTKRPLCTLQFSTGVNPTDIIALSSKVTALLKEHLEISVKGENSAE
jgi:hypothetical protein